VIDAAAQIRASSVWMLTRGVLVALALLLGMLGVSACGGGRDAASGAVVARVAGAPITKPQLSHWMSTLAGGDFYEIGRHHAVPARLVSEPPDYAACVTSLQAAAAGARNGQTIMVPTAPTETAAHLMGKCRELYVALRLQAIAYLIEARWIIKVAAEVGIRASGAEVTLKLRKIKAAEYPGHGQFQRYLAESRRSLADELLVVKLDVLEQRLGQHLSAHGRNAAIRLAEAGRKVSAEIDCRPGYVVPHCRQFKVARTTTRSPVVLLEQVATITGIPCVNRQACG
jgi:hypothetical protein